MAGPYSDDQGTPAAAIPVRLVTADGTAFYNASGAGGSSAPYQATPKGYQPIGSVALGTAQPLTVPSGATFAMIVVEGDTVRWRDDGTSPTSAIGMPIYAGPAPEQFSGDLSAVKFISTGTSTLNVSYYA